MNVMEVQGTCPCCRGTPTVLVPIYWVINIGYLSQAAHVMTVTSRGLARQPVNHCFALVQSLVSLVVSS